MTFFWSHTSFVQYDVYYTFEIKYRKSVTQIRRMTSNELPLRRITSSYFSEWEHHNWWWYSWVNL